MQEMFGFILLVPSLSCVGYNVKDYADAKFGWVPVACHLLCHYRPRELHGRGIIHPPLAYGGTFWVAQPRHP